MAGERSLVETLQDEVEQLLEAHRTIDAQHLELIDELETAALEHGNDDAQSSMAILSQGLTMVSREVEEEDLVESLVLELHERRSEFGTSSNSNLRESVGTMATPDAVSGDGDLVEKIGETRKRQEERCNQAVNTGFFEKMKALVEMNAARASSTATRDKVLQKLEQETRAVAEEKERLGEENKKAALENEEVVKNAVNLYTEVKTIEKKFAERSRYGAWVCDTHAQEVENENCPGRHMLKEGRQLLHSLHDERRELLLAFELCGLERSEQSRSNKVSVMDSVASDVSSPSEATD